MVKTKTKKKVVLSKAMRKVLSQQGSMGASALKDRLSKGKTPEQAAKAISAHYRKLSKRRK